MPFVSVMLTDVCNLAAFERQPLAFSPFNSHKQDRMCQAISDSVWSSFSGHSSQ